MYSIESWTLVNNSIVFFFSGTRADNNQEQPLVKVEAPGGYGSDFVFLYWFHPNISDSTGDAHFKFSNASPLTVYYFAYQFMLSPAHIDTKELPDGVLQQVLTAIEKGNRRYDKLYPDGQKELTPEETLQAWMSDISMKTVSKYQGTIAQRETLFQWIMHLRPDQILLIFRKKPYKVLSVTCTADPEAVCMFDSQLHIINSVVARGAFMFYCKKQLQVIATMVNKFESLCFKIIGECHFILLQKEEHIQ